MAVGEVLMPVKITLLKLWLEAWLCLSGWPQVGCSQYHSPPEVAIPLRVTDTSRGMRAPGWFSYSLNFGGQRHIIHMKAKKLLVSRDLSVFTYTEQGALLEDHPFVQTNCYYHGYVEGDPESLVSLGTCFGGFQGVLHVKDIAYEIKPKSLSTTFEHLVYKMDSEETQFPPMSCGLTDEEIARQLKFQERNNSILMQSGYEGWWTHRWIVEVAVVVDHERFLHRESNISNVQDEVIAAVNGIDGFYTSMEIDVVLRGLEIWNQGNLITIGGISEALNEFCEWKKNNLNMRISHDVAHLWLKKKFPGQLGLAYVGTVCHLKFGCAVDSFLDDDLTTFAYIVAHEMGHNLGMSHDDKTCTCGSPKCIMYPAKASATRFSNCSYSYFWEISMRKICLRDVPDPGDIFTKVHCGNGVVEEGEECDCGSLQSCNNDPCCLSNCTLNPGAACAFGLCCENCQFMPSGIVCRKKENECDLPEWCNGTSQECPEDVHMQDGFPCMDNGYCYEKRCNKRDEQCQQIFGKDAKSANMTCYMQMNTRGDRFGNCGISSNAYVRCNNSDILCGRVQCENVAEIPFLREHSTVHWIHLNGVTCWGTDYHFGMTIPDIGEVKDGTECGLQHVCINRKCVPVSFWKSDCSPKTCNMNGVCNSKHHCHCNYRWDPPNCLKEGYGGSIDSGPPPREKEEIIVLSRVLLFVILCTPSCCLFCFWGFIIWWKNVRKRRYKNKKR